jgi:hypothetical protein
VRLFIGACEMRVGGGGLYIPGYNFEHDVLRVGEEFGSGGRE